IVGSVDQDLAGVAQNAKPVVRRHLNDFRDPILVQVAHRCGRTTSRVSNAIAGWQRVALHPHVGSVLIAGADSKKVLPAVGSTAMNGPQDASAVVLIHFVSYKDDLGKVEFVDATVAIVV